jgi:hypothetical protein
MSSSFVVIALPSSVLFHQKYIDHDIGYTLFLLAFSTANSKMTIMANILITKK